MTQRNMIKAFSFCFFLLIFNGCEILPDMELSSDCPVKAIYLGTNVCHPSEDAAAVKLAYGDHNYLILENFFELVEKDQLEIGDEFYIRYDTKNYQEAPPVLCGVMIVAPVSRLECVRID